MDKNSQKINNCYKFNIKTNHITKVASIQNARSAFGIVNIKQYIYVVSGQQGLPGCERYDIINDTWEQLPPIPYDLTAVTAFKFKERYIIAVGGMNYAMYLMENDLYMTQMLVLDT